MRRAWAQNSRLLDIHVHALLLLSVGSKVHVLLAELLKKLCRGARKLHANPLHAIPKLRRHGLHDSNRAILVEIDLLHAPHIQVLEETRVRHTGGRHIGRIVSLGRRRSEQRRGSQRQTGNQPIVGNECEQRRVSAAARATRVACPRQGQPRARIPRTDPPRPRSKRTGTASSSIHHETNTEGTYPASCWRLVEFAPELAFSALTAIPAFLPEDTRLASASRQCAHIVSHTARRWHNPPPVDAFPHIRGLWLNSCHEISTPGDGQWSQRIPQKLGCTESTTDTATEGRGWTITYAAGSSPGAGRATWSRS